MLFDKVVRPTLYRLSKQDPELVHERTLRILSRLNTRNRALEVLHKRYAISDPVDIWGLRFPNRVGLAAGMDKNGRALAVWAALGFGFVEAGTVTSLAQPGNPKPRLFHLPDSQALINRMGFNNAGAEALAQRLAKYGVPKIPLGISIGKSKATPISEAIADYLASFRVLYPFADYFAINVSSPNTPGLRTLQDRTMLTELLSELGSTSAILAKKTGKSPVPLLVKVAPDLSEHALAELLEVCDEQAVSGVIATNTTLNRQGLAKADIGLAEQSGGLSGKPLADRAREVVQFIHTETRGKMPIMGVGGISTPDDARAMLDAGASLVQVYTGFALSGPTLIRQINQLLAAK